MDKNPVNGEMMPTTPSTKHNQRREVLAAIKGLDWATLSAHINRRLQECFLNCPPSIIAGFSQHKNEPDISPFLHFWHEQGGTVCLPVVVAPDHPLIFRLWDFKKPLVKGAYDIFISEGPEMIPNVILTPLIAFDKQGSRLGRGAGYYDRTLKALRNRKEKPLVIGVAAHQQCVEFLPTEPHDEPLDRVVTDREIIRFRKLLSHAVC